nr:Hsp20 family protein [Metabacillus kandeliae]
MSGAAPEWITVAAEQDQVRITLIVSEEKSERTVFLPMAANKEISACLQDGILEITIDKNGASGYPSNRTIPVQYKK